MSIGTRRARHGQQVGRAEVEVAAHLRDGDLCAVLPRLSYSSQLRNWSVATLTRWRSAGRASIAGGDLVVQKVTPGAGRRSPMPERVARLAV